tara:strand:+ start:43 stop:333 length:291 start_codon:yes stop_codon:yes gene_type:complete
MKVDEDFATKEIVDDTIYYDYKGNETDDTEEAYAKSFGKSHYVLTNRTEMIDPSARHRHADFKLKKVPQRCFDYYVQFLATREDRFLRFARRYIDG